jgi:hypothetical protein
LIDKIHNFSRLSLKPEKSPGQLAVQADLEGEVKENRRDDRGRDHNLPGAALHDLIEKQEKEKRRQEKAQGGKENRVEDQEPQGDEELSPVNFRPDHVVGLIPFPLVKKPLDEIRDSEKAQEQTRKKRHEPGLGRMKGAESELESPEANHEGKGNPNQIVDEIRFFHRVKFSSESFVSFGKENTSPGRKLQEEKNLPFSYLRDHQH